MTPSALRRTLAAAAFCALLLTPAWRYARAFRPYAVKTEAKTSWMTVSSKGQEYYMEVAADGAVVTRVATKSSIVTRRGAIKAQLAKDFFREIESSDMITSQNPRDSTLLFYTGDKLKISAYISGEIRRIDAPLKNFGEAFSYAFNEVRKAAEKLPVETGLTGFLTAEPMSEEGAEMQEYRAKAPKGIKTLEIYDIQKLKPLLKAIKQPYRLIPIEDEESEKETRAFVTMHGLYGLRKLFYLPSTRGMFRCQMLEAARRPSEDGAGAKTGPAAGPSGAKSYDRKR